MQLFDDIDEKETIRRAKKKLSEYPRWREIACDDPIQKVTQEFTFQPRGGAGPNKAVEKLAVRRVDAMIELEEIEQAVSRLFNPTYRYILFSKFLKNQKDLNYEIYNYLGIERTKFQELYNNALLAFAEQYRDAVLVCNKKNGIFAVKIR